MDSINQIINNIFLSDKSFSDFELLGFSLKKEEINSEFVSTEFTILNEDNNFFARIHISKRILVAFAQNLLKKNNILLLPEFVDTSSLILISEVLNELDEKYQIHLEISPVNLPVKNPSTDILLKIKYQKVFAPVLIQIDTEQLLNLLFKKGISFEDLSEVNLSLSGERNLPLRIIGELEENAFLKIPDKLVFIIGNQFRVGEKEIFIEEEKMENSTSISDEIEIPVIFKINLGKIRLNDIKGLLTDEKITSTLNGKECRIIIGTTTIATGEFNENQVRITKIYF